MSAATKTEKEAPSDQGEEEEFRGFYRSLDDIPKPKIGYRGGRDETEVRHKKLQALPKESAKQRGRKIDKVAFAQAWLLYTGLNTRYGPMNIGALRDTASQVAAIMRRDSEETDPDE